VNVLRPFAISTGVLALALLFGLPAGAAGGAPCSALTATAQGGVIFRVLFAHNGAVQRYQLIRSSHNPEIDNGTQRRLIERYGPEAIDAPPLRILTFRPAPGGGFKIPDKAVDSCGRISHFQ
jgi:hypothetical protein